ncbi:hypothetical protein [Panacagrimonas sp.]|uniref:hypothetical protein n=1 Tax=Panacagrimonas sp. TaxID=2480088 RepID=UPI003B5195F8
MALAFVLTAIAFAAGLGLSWWQARRRFRRHLADRLAREVEREMARRVLADLQTSGLKPPDAPR